VQPTAQPLEEEGARREVVVEQPHATAARRQLEDAHLALESAVLPKGQRHLEHGRHAVRRGGLGDPRRGPAVDRRADPQAPVIGDLPHGAVEIREPPLARRALRERHPAHHVRHLNPRHPPILSDTSSEPPFDFPPNLRHRVDKTAPSCRRFGGWGGIAELL